MILLSGISQMRIANHYYLKWIFILEILEYYYNYIDSRHNKRAQRALGRSPEEKVKGNSGANNREPQGHNLNNFGRGPFDDVIN